ncbi:MAG: DUF971 domain-containing protein [Calditrichaeota bacterium]|nr:MAG: DUF971 domain-containing protein [Calditrichota bacterium]
MILLSRTCKSVHISILILALSNSFKTVFPVDVKKVEPNRLVIIWDDGHESLYSLQNLRRNCPCATCKNIKSSKQDTSPLKILSPQEIIPEDIEVWEAEVIGRYALQFRWSDGHHEGIYSFDYLRKLCECEKCRSNY